MLVGNINSTDFKGIDIMRAINKKRKIIIIVLTIIFLFVINEITASYTPVSTEFLDEIEKIDWSIENLLDNGFYIDDKEVLFYIHDPDGGTCYISVTEDFEVDNKMKKHHDLLYSVQGNRYGVFDMRRYLGSNYISTRYTFIYEGVNIYVSEYHSRKSTSMFMDFVDQMNNGSDKIVIRGEGTADRIN